MNIRLWLILVFSISLEARNLGRRRSREHTPQQSDLSDDEILEVLSDLILVMDDTRDGSQGDLESKLNVRQLADQILKSAPFEKCELVGYEFKKGEECQEVFEVECGIANVTKLRTELVKKCKTNIDQKCEVTMTEVPQQYCQQRLKHKCEISYHIIEEEIYNEECKLDTKHFCNEQLEEPAYGSETIRPPEYIEHQQAPYYHDGYHGEQSHRIRRNQEFLDSSEHRDPPQTMSVYEVAAPPGCRSVVTKICYKVPRVVPKKVPYSSCHPVPTLDCGLVLRSVPGVECTPHPKEECKDVANDIPYIVTEEQCEQVVYDECQEVETRIPVDICKRRRLDEESIFLSRGEVFRKEGEKRRKKLFRRPTKGSEQLSGNSTVSVPEDKDRKGRFQTDLF